MTTFRQRLRTLLPMLIGCALLAAGPAAAQYPTKPIRLVVPFAAGSAPDALARSVAGRLTARLGQPVVVENKAGAGGNAGAEFVARQPADGNTLLLATESHPVNPSLYGKVGYDPIKDFAPVALLVRMPALLVVPVNLSVKSVAELIAVAKANPGMMNYGSGGNGSQAHLAGAMFRNVAGVYVVHVPYKDAPEVIASMLSGRTQVAFLALSAALPQVQAGKLRALAVTSPRRNPLLPDVPTLVEAMPNGFAMEAWLGIWAPAGTPPDVVRKLNTEIRAVLADPDFRAKLAADGSEVVTGGSPEEFAAYVKAETARWTRLVRDAGVRVE